jgi:putative cardiolipin synthase
MPTPDVALDARAQLITRAQISIDVQYYEIHQDTTGKYFLRLLRDAAARGVRVRLLLDDLHTSGQDELLLAFAAHDNVEVRLFNPFFITRGSLQARYIAAFFDLKRLNRRMHNKLLIADGVMAVSGGRNIGDEYFQTDEAANFLDLDALSCGALPAELSEVFDEYWNSDSAVPVGAVTQSRLGAQALHDFFEETTVEAAAPTRPPTSRPDILGHTPLYEQFARGSLHLEMGTATVYADPPDKILRPRLRNSGMLDPRFDGALVHVRERVRSAKRSVLQTTPYLVPGNEGLESMRLLRERGVSFAIVTNSLASVDESLVFPGYRKYRRAMLNLGVELYEFSPQRITRDSARFGQFGKSTPRLHAKTAVIDEEMIFVGSVNFDPRSEKYNTEIAVFIESPALARQLAQLIGILKGAGAYSVRMSVTQLDQLEWVFEDLDGQHVLQQEPEVSGWRAFFLELFNLFAPEDLL